MTEFKTWDHTLLLRERHREIRCCHVINSKSVLEKVVSDAPNLDARQLRRGTKSASWLTLQPSTANGTELGAQEWQDALLLCYGIYTPYLPYHCNGCNATFSIYHALYGKKGRLITTFHTDLRDGVAELSGKAFTPSHMNYDHLIHPVHAVREGKANLTKNHPWLWRIWRRRETH